VCPVLIQNAAKDPRYHGHPAVRWGFTRYLGVPIRNPEGDAIGTVCFLDNRSSSLLGPEDVEFLSILAMRVSAELERERLTDARLEEAQQAHADLAVLNAQLTDAAEEKRRFVATVIHDLRQPLATLRTLTYVLRMEEDEQERAECLELLDERATAISAMVDELLEYVQIEAGRIPWRAEPVALADVLAACLEQMAPEAEARGVRLLLETSADLGESRTDRARLCHVVGNLVSNAVKFTACGAGKGAPAHGKGVVRLQASSSGSDAWTLVVEDNGVGMSDAVVERIFEEFYQAPTARTSEAGTGYPQGRGLGLAIVRHLCTLMGASIAVKSRPGAGTRFTLTLPRDQSRPKLAAALSECIEIGHNR